MKKPKAPSVVVVLILTTITIVFWIFFSVLKVLTKRPEVDVSPTLLKKFSPTLNTDPLDNMPNALFFAEDDVQLFTDQNNPSTTKTPMVAETPAITLTPTQNEGQPATLPE